MNVRFPFFMLLSAAVLYLVLMIGCGQPGQTGADREAADRDTTQPDSGGDHTAIVDPHDVPITEEQKQQLREEMANFAGAVILIEKFRDTVQEETRNGLPDNPFAVHQALDKVDIVVQWLPKIAQDSDIPKEHWEKVTTAANELREFFDQIHLNIDNKVDPDFASAEQQMDARIGYLEAIAQ